MIEEIFSKKFSLEFDLPKMGLLFWDSNLIEKTNIFRKKMRCVTHNLCFIRNDFTSMCEICIGSRAVGTSGVRGGMSPRF